ncbi:MAG TPA: hypothetical protein VF669_10460 [Tepidisphaeraceae bacterium]
MSDLRKQLQDAKDEYLSETYPGDLAAELLQPRMRIGRVIAFAGPLTALAAAVIVYVGIAHRSAEQKTGATVAYQTPQQVQRPSQVQKPTQNHVQQQTQNQQPQDVVGEETSVSSISTATPTDTANGAAPDSLMPSNFELSPSSSGTFSVPAVELVPSWSDINTSTSSDTSSNSQEST